MVASLLFALPALACRRAALLGGVPCSFRLLLELALVGVLMAATSAARTLGLQRAGSSAVASLLYTEIAWCFALELLVLRAAAAPLKLAGAALIVGGAALSAVAA